jgi:hypothetical protein
VGSPTPRPLTIGQWDVADRDRHVRAACADTARPQCAAA